MCNTFLCLSCHKDFFDRCEEASFESATHCGRAKPSDTTACEACRTVKGAIFELRTLVVVAPFLETLGIAGLEDTASWEREELEKLLLKKDKRGWADKAESREERHEFAEKRKKMGLVEVEDARGEHQGFVTVVTPVATCRGNAGEVGLHSGDSNDSDKENVPPPSKKASA